MLLAVSSELTDFEMLKKLHYSLIQNKRNGLNLYDVLRKF